jgi:hypothetical protein
MILATVMMAGCAELVGPEQNAKALAEMTPAMRCETSLPFFGVYRASRDSRPEVIPADGRMDMGNDGGWCVIRLRPTGPSGGLARFPAVVRTPPAHGEVVVGTLDGQLRIAYRPARGFAGEDQFLVRTTSPMVYDIPVRVRVGS